MKKLKLSNVLIILAVTCVIILVISLIDKRLTSNEVMDVFEMDTNLEIIKESDILILVNSENKIPDDYNARLVEFRNHYVSSYIKKDLEKMFYVASKENIELVINNAYRSSEEQKEIFDERVKKLEEEGMPYIDAYNEVKKMVNLPGYSEHETGLAIDFSCGIPEDNAKMWIWLSENSYKYGFILRYPKEKEEITNINYEAWHYRYVGKDIARYMYHNDLCLEEYLDK